MSEVDGSRWPGDSLGLPETGPRSVARLPRRAGAILVDWAIATILSFALSPAGEWQTNGFVTLGIFGVLQIVFLLVLNGSFGHVLFRMRVVPLVPGHLGLWRPLVRTALLCLGVPALIWDRNQRGLHDRAAGTVLVRV